MSENRTDSGESEALQGREVGTVGCEQVLRDERRHIFGDGDRDGKKKLYGLAFSGGGIRSAVFSLGVMQALHRNRMLERFHYLSTVSGGGYIGSCLTWLLHGQSKGGKPEYNTSDRFPLGKPGADGSDEVATSVLRHLRQSSNYLTPGGDLTMASLLAVILRGSLLSTLVYVVPLIAIMVVLVAIHAFGAPDILARHGNTGWNALLCAAGAFALVFAVLAVMYGLGTSRRGRSAAEAYRLRRAYEKRAGLILKLTVVLLAFGLLPLVSVKVHELAAAGMAGGGLLASILAIFKARSGKEGRIPLGLLAPLAFVLLVYGLLLLSFEAGLAIRGSGSWFVWEALLGGVALAALLGTQVNINYISIHRYYRDRLMELFMPDMDDVRDCNCAATADAANDSKLHEMTRPGSKPYHLINANMVTEGSHTKRLKERGGENFLLSPLYCGSEATGWLKTEDYMGQKMNLATAMAISGAAADPHGAPGGSGLTRNRSLSFLMALFNVRLGYWAPNPALYRVGMANHPNWFSQGWREAFGTRMDETSEFVHLADGGHFENLALYELIRRKVQAIVVCDGAADTGFAFGDFANFVEKVRVDFGVDIEVQGHPDFTLEGKRAKSLLGLCPRPNPYHEHGVPLADTGFVIANIHYGGGVPDGTLIYIKTTLIGGLPDDIYTYKRENPDFPDETTADQFFDEKQFEAYRELGYGIGQRLADSNEVKKALGMRAGRAAKAS